jgi:hypothetical protein
MAGSRIELLVTVKAYPAISKTYGEAVCVAGVRTDIDPEWVRLYPIRFRDLSFSRQFKKYQIVTMEASPHRTDQRPESWRPVEESLEAGEVLDTTGNWAKRRKYVDPLVVESMCAIQRDQGEKSTSLGVFRPEEVIDFTIEELSPEWDYDKQAVIDQPSLFGPGKAGLEKIPYRFRYRYRCSDRSCNGHHQSIIDWELGQAYRTFRERYGSEDETLMKLREKWLDDMCGVRKDTHFFVGNQRQHPESFLVLGVFYPPAP